MTEADDDLFPFAFVTIAIGKRFYLEMAVDMVLTLRRFHDEPIVLLAHGPCLELARALYSDVFDRIIALPESPARERRAKFLIADFTPAQSALFIDADILVLKPVDYLIERAGHDPVAMMGSFLPADSPKRHHGIRVSRLCARFGTDRFFTSHSAAILFDRERSRQLFREAALVHEDMLDLKPGPFIGDELAFGIAAARQDMARMPDPFPVIWSSEMEHLDVTASPKAFLHFHTTPPNHVVDPVLEIVAALRRERGFDVAISNDAWRLKSKRNSSDPVAAFRKMQRRIRKLTTRFVERPA